MAFALTGGRVFTGEAIVEGQAVVVADGRVEALQPEGRLPRALPRRSLDGRLLAPGFIDVQVNGGGGVLFNDVPTVAGIRAIAAAHRRYGTTGLLPTLISDEWAKMSAAAEAVRDALTSGVPGVLGIHFEGPYLNPARKGVHDAAKLRPLDAGAVALLAAPGLGRALVTLAPEAVPTGTVRRLAAAGVRVAAGHTAASHAQVRQALAEGLSCFTHLFNAMTPLTSRAPGVVGAALDDPDSWCGLIVDGHHVHPATLRVAVRAKPRGKMLLVTDAMPTVGTATKTFTLGGAALRAVGGRLATADGTLAGSDLDMAAAVRNAVKLLGLPLEEALRMAARYPAEFLGLDDELGRIAPGYRANLVLLEQDGTVRETWIDGQGGAGLGEE